MEASKSRLSRLLNRLRGDHHKYCLDKGISFTSSAMSEGTECDPADELDPPVIQADNDDRFTPNIDLRYGGQYLTPEQLPIFCDQLHHLVDVIRNVQAYAEITGEYPTELERRLEREAREVAALAAETRNARDVIARARLQRRALKDHRAQLTQQLAALKDTEVRELESTVRLSDRKLFKNWESLKDSNDPNAFEPLLEEIRSKQTALECLVHLIDGRRATISKATVPPHPLPPPLPKDNDGTEPSSQSSSARRRAARRNKRRRSSHSAPLSGESSATHTPQVTLYIQGSDTTRRAGSVPVSPIDLTSAASVRDILFFTTHNTT